MRSLANDKLKEQEFKIISLGIIVDPDNYIQIKKIDSSNADIVKMRLPLTIGYKKWKQSDMRLPGKNGKFDRYEHRKLVKVNDSVIVEKRKKILKAQRWSEGPVAEEIIEIENNYYCNLSLTIDKFGNYSPIRIFYFVGYCSGLRVGDALPLNYNLGD